MLNIDAVGNETRNRLFSERVVAHKCNKSDLGTSPRGCHCLVGAFTTGCCGKCPLADRLARLWQAGKLGYHVSVRTPDDDDFVIHYLSPLIHTIPA